MSGYPVLVRGADFIGSRIIYGLVDPAEPDVIRYVGQTMQAPIARYLGHMNGLHPKHRRYKWFRSLRHKRRQPDMVLLEAVPGRLEH